MTRGRVAAVAVAVLAAIGWWLFRGGPTEPTGPSPEPGTARPAAVDGVSSNDTHDPAVLRPKPVPGIPVAGPDEDVPAAPAELLSSEGTCVLEDGTPLPGVEFLTTQGIGDLPIATRSGPDGTFHIYRDMPTALAFTTAAPVSADGGILSKGETGGWTVTATADRLRLTFRDKTGWAHVRLVDADSGTPVTKVTGLRVTWRIPGGTLTMGYGEDQAPGGWIPLPEGRLPETGSGGQAGIDVDISKVEVEFAMPGFEKGRLALADIRGRMEIRVRPVPPDATGVVRSLRVLTMPLTPTSDSRTATVKEVPVSAHLRWTGPEPAPRASEVLGLPTVSGPFSLFDLPDGSWEIEVSAVLADNTVVRGKKAFEMRDATVDLGTIELRPAGKVALRVVDSAGEPIPQAWAVVVRPEEDPDQGRRLDLNQRGEVSVGDLEPGVGHRVVVKGLPRDLEQTVVAAADAKPVEFMWNEKLVPCRITLIVDGKAVANPDGRTTIPAVVQESPLPRDKGAWKSDGTFEAKLVPGSYRFSALATPKEGGDLAVFSGEVTVPSGDSFEARLELQRGSR